MWLQGVGPQWPPFLSFLTERRLNNLFNRSVFPYQLICLGTKIDPQIGITPWPRLQQGWVHRGGQVGDYFIILNMKNQHLLKRNTINSASLNHTQELGEEVSRVINIMIFKN